MSEFANEVPMRVIGMLLGIPEADQEAVRERVDAKLRTEPGQQMKVSGGALMDTDLFADYIDWRAEHPSDDLMTELLNAEFDDENGVHRTLTREEILTYVTVVAGAGNETTARLIGWLIGLLDQHPDQRAELVADPLADPGRHRGNAALRADRPRRRALRHDRRRVTTARPSRRAAR